VSGASTWRSWLLRIVLGLAITVGLVTFLLQYVDPRQVGAMLGRMDLALGLLGLGIWVLVYVVRSLRFVLLAPRTPYPTMLCIAAVHNFFLRVLPLRTGELSYAFLVKRAGTAGLGESLVGLLLLRAIDATTVIVLFTVTLSLHKDVYLGDRRLGIVVAAAGAAVGIVVVAVMGRLLRLLLHLLEGAARLLRLSRRPSVERTLTRIGASVEWCASIRPSLLVRISLASLLLWLLTYSAFFAIMRSFSMPVGVAQTVLGSTAGVVTGFLPIGGIGSFGTLEAGWAGGFVLVGLARPQAVASGFGVSIVTLGYAVLLGLLGWIGLALIGRRRVT